MAFELDGRVTVFRTRSFDDQCPPRGRSRSPRFVVLLAGLFGALVGASCARDRADLRGVVREFALPNEGGAPGRIAVGQDGAIWFTDEEANAIGRLSPERSNRIEELTLPTGNAHPRGLTVGRDGAVWFVEERTDCLGRVDAAPPHRIVEIQVPTSNAGLSDLVCGADGALWFLEGSARRVGRLALPSRKFDEWTLPSDAVPISIVASPAGDLFFTEAPPGIGRIDPKGLVRGDRTALTELALDGVKGGLSRLAVDQRGDLWVAENAANHLIRMGGEGPHLVTEYALRVPSTSVYGIAAGSDGDVWFGSTSANCISRLTRSGTFEEFPLPTANASPNQLALGRDGAIWFTESSARRIGRLLPPRGRDTGNPPSPLVRTEIRSYTPGRQPGPKGAIDVETDAEIVLLVDGERVDQLPAGSRRMEWMPAGPHVLTALGVGTGRTWGRAVVVVPRAALGIRIEGLGIPERDLPRSEARLPKLLYARISPGEFVMGGRAAPEEEPAHRVRITRAFEILTTEVTQEQWALVSGRNPARFEHRGPDLPVNGVSHEDVEEFLRRLDALEPAYRHRLPTEAEWEYACRAGEAGPYAGQAASSGQPALFVLRPAGESAPNAWGIHDMLDNVAEWCSDWWDLDAYRRSALTDPGGPAAGTEFVIRGGDYRYRSGERRASMRRHAPPTERSDWLGFRFVRISR